MIIKLIIIIGMLAILFNLFRSLYFLATSKTDSKKVVRSLSWRIGFSVTLFILVVIAIMMGWIEPHGLPNVKPE